MRINNAKGQQYLLGDCFSKFEVHGNYKGLEHGKIVCECLFVIFAAATQLVRFADLEIIAQESFANNFEFAAQVGVANNFELVVKGGRSSDFKAAEQLGGAGNNEVVVYLCFSKNIGFTPV